MVKRSDHIRMVCIGAIFGAVVSQVISIIFLHNNPDSVMKDAVPQAQEGENVIDAFPIQRNIKYTRAHIRKEEYNIDDEKQTKKRSSRRTKGKGRQVT